MITGLHFDKPDGVEGTFIIRYGMILRTCDFDRYGGKEFHRRIQDFEVSRFVVKLCVDAEAYRQLLLVIARGKLSALELEPAAETTLTIYLYSNCKVVITVNTAHQ